MIMLNVFASFLLILYCSFTSLIILSIAMTSFYIKGYLSITSKSTVSITQKEYGFAVHFL